MEFIVAHGLSCDQDFKFYIQSSVVLIGFGVEIRKGFGIGRWSRGGWGAEGFESGHGCDPGGDGGREVFCKEGAEGLVLPGLDVAGGPVVE